MLPDDKDASDIRAIIHKIFTFRNKQNVPLAFYKQYKFQIRQKSKVKGH